MASALMYPVSTLAQAWLPEASSFSYTVSYSNIYNTKHFLPTGDEIDVGHTRTQSMGFSAGYSFTDLLTVSAGIPYVVTQYQGNFPHRMSVNDPRPIEVDDGHAHGTFTDFHVELHLQALDGPLALAPYLAAVVPSHEYATMGHAAPGRGLNEFWMGFYAGTSLDLWIPRTYVQGRYNYALVEKVVGIKHDRTNIDAEIGYFFTPDWAARAFGLWQETHGGIDVPIPLSNPLYPHHDQLAAEDYLNVGAGFAWSVSPKINLDLVYITAVRGRNGHKVDQNIAIGFTFSPGGH